MHYKKAFLLFSGIVFITSVDALPDNTQNRTLATYELKSESITKARVALLDNFLAGNMKKVIYLENYLSNSLANKDYIALYPIEDWLIKYQVKDYRGIIKSVRSFDSVYLSLKRKVRPQPDDLLKLLNERSLARKKPLADSIKSAPIPGNYKDFLTMHLYSCLTSEMGNSITQDTLNALADNYLRKYPGDSLIPFIRKYIRFEYLPATWGLAVEFFSGYGIFTGDISSHFTNNIPIGIAFDIYYKDFVLYLRDYIGFSYTKHEFNTGRVVWSKHAQVRVYLPEASVGYVVHNGKFFRLAPFLGIASTCVSPTSHDEDEHPELKDYELTFTTTWVAGFTADFKFGRPRESMKKNGTKQNYVFLRLRYTCALPQFGRYFEGFGGDIHCLTLGLGIMSRKVKREY